MFLDEVATTFSVDDLARTTDEQLVSYLNQTSDLISNMALSALESEDKQAATEVMANLDEILGRVGNISSFPPEKFKELANCEFFHHFS